MSPGPGSESPPIPSGGGRRDASSGETIGKLPDHMFLMFGGRAGPARRLPPSPPGEVSPTVGKAFPSSSNVIGIVTDHHPSKGKVKDSAIQPQEGVQKTADEQQKVMNRRRKEGGVKEEKEEAERDKLKSTDSEQLKTLKSQKKEEEEKEKVKKKNLGSEEAALVAKKQMKKKKEQEKTKNVKKHPIQEERKEHMAQGMKQPEASAIDPASPKKSPIAGVGGKDKSQGALCGGEDDLAYVSTLESGGTTLGGLSYVSIAQRGVARRELAERLEPPSMPSGTLLSSDQAVLLSFQKDSWISMAAKESSQLHVVQSGKLYHVCLVAKGVCTRVQLRAGLVVKRVSSDFFFLSNGLKKFGLSFTNGKESNVFMDTIEGILRSLETNQILSRRKFQIPTRNRFGALQVDADMVVNEDNSKDQLDRTSRHSDPRNATTKKKEKIDLVAYLNLPNSPMPPRKLKSSTSAEQRVKKAEEEPGTPPVVNKKAQRRLKPWTGTPEPDPLSAGKFMVKTSNEPRKKKEESPKKPRQWKVVNGSGEATHRDARKLEPKELTKIPDFIEGISFPSQTSFSGITEKMSCERLLASGVVLLWTKDKDTKKLIRHFGATRVTAWLYRNVELEQFRVDGCVHQEDQENNKKFPLLEILPSTIYDFSDSSMHKWTESDGTVRILRFLDPTEGDAFAHSIELAIHHLTMIEKMKKLESRTEESSVPKEEMLEEKSTIRKTKVQMTELAMNAVKDRADLISIHQAQKREFSVGVQDTTVHSNKLNQKRHEENVPNLMKQKKTKTVGNRSKEPKTSTFNSHLSDQKSSKTEHKPSSKLKMLPPSQPGGPYPGKCPIIQRVDDMEKAIYSVDGKGDNGKNVKKRLGKTMEQTTELSQAKKIGIESPMSANDSEGKAVHPSVSFPSATPSSASADADNETAVEETEDDQALESCSARSSTCFLAKKSQNLIGGTSFSKKLRKRNVRSGTASESDQHGSDMEDDVFETEIKTSEKIRVEQKPRRIRSRSLEVKQFIKLALRYSTDAARKSCGNHYRMVTIRRRRIIIPKRKCRCGYCRGFHCPRVTKMLRMLGLSTVDFDHYAWDGRTIPTVVGGAERPVESEGESETEEVVHPSEVQDLEERRQLIEKTIARFQRLRRRRSLPATFPDDIRLNDRLESELWEYIYRENLVPEDLFKRSYWATFLRERLWVCIRSPHLLMEIVHKSLIKQLWNEDRYESILKINFMWKFGVPVSEEQEEYIAAVDHFRLHTTAEGIIYNFSRIHGFTPPLSETMSNDDDNDMDDMEDMDDAVIERPRGRPAAQSPISPARSSRSRSNLTLPISPMLRRRKAIPKVKSTKLFPIEDVCTMLNFMHSCLEKKQNIRPSAMSFYTEFIETHGVGNKSVQSWKNHYLDVVRPKLYLYPLPPDKLMFLYKKLNIRVTGIQRDIETKLNLKITVNNEFVRSWRANEMPRMGGARRHVHVAILPEDEEEQRRVVRQADRRELGPFQLYMPDFPMNNSMDFGAEFDGNRDDNEEEEEEQQ